MKIAHAGHAELLVNNLEASKKFFTETMGLFITEEDATSVYLRAWQDWEHHTLILRKGEKPALVHLGWRAYCSRLSGVSTDRKSTRLNSSHQIISYAVFCLKKKKNIQKSPVR